MTDLIALAEAERAVRCTCGHPRYFHVFYTEGCVGTLCANSDVVIVCQCKAFAAPARGEGET